ncbi:MAG: hypothetical protein ABGX63_04905, partial [bacterium]
LLESYSPLRQIEGGLSPVSTSNTMEPPSEHPVPLAVLLFQEPSQMPSGAFPRPSDNSPTFLARETASDPGISHLLTQLIPHALTNQNGHREVV